MGVLPGITHKYRHINSDDFGGHLVLRIEDQERNIKINDRHVIGLEIAKIVYHLFSRMGSRTYKIVKGPMGIVVILISSSDNDKPVSSPLIFLCLEICGK